MNDIMFTLARTRKKTHSFTTNTSQFITQNSEHSLTALGTEQTNRADADVSILQYIAEKIAPKRDKYSYFFGSAVLY